MKDVLKTLGQHGKTSTGHKGILAGTTITACRQAGRQAATVADVQMKLQRLTRTVYPQATSSLTEAVAPSSQMVQRACTAAPITRNDTPTLCWHGGCSY